LFGSAMAVRALQPATEGWPQAATVDLPFRDGGAFALPSASCVNINLEGRPSLSGTRTQDVAKTSKNKVVQPPLHPCSRVLATNASWICYGRCKGQVRIIGNAATGSHLLKVEEGLTVADVALHPEMNVLAVVFRQEDDGAQVCLYKLSHSTVTEGQVDVKLKARLTFYASDQVQRCLLHDDGRMLVTSTTTEVTIWDLAAMMPKTGPGVVDISSRDRRAGLCSKTIVVGGGLQGSPSAPLPQGRTAASAAIMQRLASRAQATGSSQVIHDICLASEANAVLVLTSSGRLMGWKVALGNPGAGEHTIVVSEPSVLDVAEASPVGWTPEQVQVISPPDRQEGAPLLVVVGGNSCTQLSCYPLFTTVGATSLFGDVAQRVAVKCRSGLGGVAVSDPTTGALALVVVNEAYEASVLVFNVASQWRDGPPLQGGIWASLQCCPEQVCLGKWPTVDPGGGSQGSENMADLLAFYLAYNSDDSPSAVRIEAMKPPGPVPATPAPQGSSASSAQGTADASGGVLSRAAEPAPVGAPQRAPASQRSPDASPGSATAAPFQQAAQGPPPVGDLGVGAASAKEILETIALCVENAAPELTGRAGGSISFADLNPLVAAVQKGVAAKLLQQATVTHQALRGGQSAGEVEQAVGKRMDYLRKMDLSAAAAAPVPPVAGGSNQVLQAQMQQMMQEMTKLQSSHQDVLRRLATAEQSSWATGTRPY